MAKNKNEQKFLSGLKNDFKRHGLYYYKIPDTPTSARFMLPKPFDCFIGVQGRLGGLEAKYADSSKRKSISWKDLRDCQHEGLTKIIEGGGLGYVFYQIKFGNELRLYFWEYRDFEHLTKKKSVKIPEFESKRFHVPGIKDRFGNLTYDLGLFQSSWNFAWDLYYG